MGDDGMNTVIGYTRILALSNKKRGYTTAGGKK